MQKLQIFVINSRSGKQLGFVRNPIHLLDMLTEEEEGLLLTPPLPSYKAYCTLGALKRKFQGRLGSVHWFIQQWINPNGEMPFTRETSMERERSEDLIQTLQRLTNGRFVTEERIMLTLRQQGYWPAHISRALDLGVFRSDLIQLPGIQNRPWGVQVCVRCSSQNVMPRPCSHCGQGDCPVCMDCTAVGENRGCSTFITAKTVKKTGTRRRNIAFHLDYELTTAQEDASQELIRFVRGSHKRALVWAACGAGKTEVTFGAIQHVLCQGGQVLFAIPRLDIVKELAQRCAEAFPGLEIAVHHGGQPWFAHGDLVVATTHQVLHFYRRFDLVILDEVDAFPYHGSEMLRFGVERAVALHGKIVEMTATPNSIPKGRLVITIPARYHGFPLPEPEIHTITLPPWEELQAHSVPPIVVDTLRDRNEPWLVFAPTIAACTHIQGVLEEVLGVEVGICHSKDPKRGDTIERFRQGALEVVVTTSVLERGVTFPRVHVMVLYADHPLFNSSTLVQMAGRVGRTLQYPSGQVLFLGSKTTSSMREARRMIQRLNREAEQKGLLGGEGNA